MPPTFRMAKLYGTCSFAVIRPPKVEERKH